MRVFILLMFICFLASNVVAGKWEVWYQPPDYSGTGVSSQSAWDYSCQAADDWIDDMDVPIFAVGWWGTWWYDTDGSTVHPVYWNDSPTFYTVDEQDIFVIEFWSDEPGPPYSKPNTKLATYTLDPSDWHYDIAYQDPSSGKVIYLIYAYLDPTFCPDVDTIYWISIYTLCDHYVYDPLQTPWNAQWFWQKSEDHWNGYSVGRHWWWTDEDWHLWSSANDFPQPEDLDLAFWIYDELISVQSSSLGEIKALFH